MGERQQRIPTCTSALTIAGASRPKRCEAQLLAQKQHRAPLARDRALGRPRRVQGLLPGLTLRRRAQADGQAQAPGLPFIHLGVQVKMDSDVWALKCVFRR